MSIDDPSGIPDRFVPSATWLRDFAAGTPGVVAAYLGGSLATDRVDADSDLDGQVMVEPGRTRRPVIHGRPLPHRFKPLEDFYLVGAVVAGLAELALFELGVRFLFCVAHCVVFSFQFSVLS